MESPLKRSIGPLALFTVMVCMAFACSQNDWDTGCKTDTDCPSGRYCAMSSGECVYDCTYDDECPENLSCADGI